MVYTELEMCLEIWNPWVRKPASAPDLSLLMDKGPSIVWSQQFSNATVYLINLHWDEYWPKKKDFRLIFNDQNRVQNWTQRFLGSWEVSAQR